jgi:hypothetical protein
MQDNAIVAIGMILSICTQNSDYSNLRLDDDKPLQQLSWIGEVWRAKKKKF